VPPGPSNPVLVEPDRFVHNAPIFEGIRPRTNT
jgi:hypothetical protein